MNTFYGVQLDTVSEGSVSQSVYILQVLLTSLGYSLGTLDGEYGPRTKKAVLAFKKAKSLSATDVVDMKVWNVIFNSRR